MADKLKKQRSTILLTVKNIQNYVDSINSATPNIDEIEINIELLEEARNQFNDLQAKIEEKAPPVAENAVDENAVERTTFTQNYVKIKAKLRSFIPKPGQAQPVPQHGPRTHMELPVIDLPSFDGKYTDWNPFQDLFKALVHDNPTLSNVQKLQYLKTSLKGDAANLLRNIQTIDVNYAKAWETLQRRYNNTRLTIFAHLKAIFTVPAVTSESHQALRKLANTVSEHVKALELLGQPVQHWDQPLIYHLRERMDPETRKQWELTITPAELQTFPQIIDFLDRRCRALEASGTSCPQSKPKSSGHAPQHSRTVAAHHTAQQEKCRMCNKEHKMFRCTKFHALSLDDKRKFLDTHKDICINCLNVHPLNNCTFGHCKKCSDKHHTSLHIDQPSVSANLASHLSNNQPNSQAPTDVLLATAVIAIPDLGGNNKFVRALLDPGSQANFVSDKLVKQLRLIKIPDTTSIVGIGATENTRSRGAVTVTLRSLHSAYTQNTIALVLPKVASALPSRRVNCQLSPDIYQLPLADRHFDQPADIDVLLGADVCARVFTGEKTVIANGPAAFRTEFGWVLMGSCGQFDPIPLSTVSANLCINLEEQMNKFWEIEAIPSKPCFTQDEQQCESHFQATHSRDQSGRYIVQLPFKHDEIPDLGRSRTIATRHLLRQEQRLAKNPQLAQQYTEFMAEYLALGHMEECSFNSQVSTYYIPHFAVLREESTTTKVRVVFNASTKTDKEMSLNSTLLVGPTIQDNLIDLLMRFRLHRIALTADIEKMYRQIWVDPLHRNMQRIVWRASPHDEIKDYILKTVTYGTASAPFLATRTLRQLAEDAATHYPLAAKILKTDFYVDDLLSGADTESEAKTIQVQLTQLLASAGFNLRKWSSNSTTALPGKSDKVVQEFPIERDTSSITRTLGILWNTTSDTFGFQVSVQSREHVTKRSVLSDTARLFDPLGWLAPCILLGKILMQKLWLTQMNWDDELPEPLRTEWQTLIDEFPLLATLQINRHIGTHRSATQIELHGFSDASEAAYGAVVYARVVNSDGSVNVSLLTAKSRVAPIKQRSIPQLELCGALMAAQLLQSTSDILQLPNCKVFAWTDSTIVLHWLSHLPRKWKTFVANRVAAIQELLAASQWRHVSTNENPADYCSRGLTPSQLINQALWWMGPPWLQDPHADFNSLPTWNSPQPDLELREPAIVHTFMTLSDDTVNQYSSLSKLLRITAYILRFVQNSRKTQGHRKYGPLDPQDLEAALLVRVRQAQNQTFWADLQGLQATPPNLPPKSHLRSLHPFVDGEGLLRVGGRLQNSSLPFHQKHQLILPHNNPLTLLIIRDAHLRNLHAEGTLLMAVLRRKFWILRARNAIRSITHQCVPCAKSKAQLSQQLMGSLPSQRVEPSRPFLHCGIDYAGPIPTRAKTGRGRFITTKSYVVLFVCLAVKAIHLEVASDLSTPGFVAAYRRFVARRGLPSDLYSDNGTNFVGANSEMQQIQLASHMTDSGTKWHFNPPSAPHFGGLWEAGVKSTKQHLKRVLGNQVLTYEELSTLLATIEGCLNSRPLCPLSDSPDSLDPLTPGHFLIGQPLVAVPSADVRDMPINRLTRWQMVERMSQAFWHRWSEEYIHQLQQRVKWNASKDNLRVGDIVLIKNEQTQPFQWPLGRITDAFDGKDGLVRVVTVRCKGGPLKRPVAKLVKLPVNSD